MSGHSKWSTIKRKKAIEDSKRSARFTKLARAITVATREGKNEAAIKRAQTQRMPKENIQRAIDKGLGRGGGSAALESFRLEGYGFGGVAIIVDVITDNRNRTVCDVRTLFSKNGGSLGESGSAGYVFGATPENPQFTVAVTSLGDRKKVQNLLSGLEDLDDVQKVYSNLDVSENTSLEK